MKSKSIHVVALCGILALASSSDAADATNGCDWTASRLSREICGPDEWESFNRAMFWIDDKAMTYLGDPLCRVYCSIVPRPLVKGVDNAVENVKYPIRFFSSLFRAEWTPAWTETERFFVNTTVGLGGLFDPALYWCGIFPTDSSLSGTFAAWGIPKGPSLVLPLVPRANVRDCAGYICDRGLDPKTYFDLFFPTGAIIGWTAVFWPNDVAVWIDPWEANIPVQPDPYSMFRQVVSAKSLLDENYSTYRYASDLMAGRAQTQRPPVRENLKRPAGLRGRWRDIADYEPRTPALDTLRLRLFTPRRDKYFWWEPHSLFNRDFAKDVQDRTVAVNTNFPCAQYGFVPAPEEAAPEARRRLFFVIPGISGSHDSDATRAMAELINAHGAAVVLCDDPFCWQYMMSANEGVLPGFLPADARRFASFARAVLADLKRENLVDGDPSVSVVGWSMGGLLTAHLSSLAEKGELGFSADTFLAINPPVSFDTIVTKMSDFLAPTRAWSSEEAKTNFVDVTSRVLVWDKLRQSQTPDITESDARIVVAMALGATLPGLVGCVTHTNADVSVEDYFYRHLAAAYPEMTSERRAYETGLRSLEKTLCNQRALKMIHTRDDFLLSEGDRDYLDRTLGDRLTWFAAGTHCGNFYTPEFQKEVIDRLGLSHFSVGLNGDENYGQ